MLFHIRSCSNLCIKCN